MQQLGLYITRGAGRTLWIKDLGFLLPWMYTGRTLGTLYHSIRVSGAKLGNILPNTKEVLLHISRAKRKML